MAQKKKTVKPKGKVLKYDLEAMVKEFPEEYALISGKKQKKGA